MTTLNRSKEWWIARAKAEGDATIGAGLPSLPCWCCKKSGHACFCVMTTTLLQGREMPWCKAHEMLFVGEHAFEPKSNLLSPERSLCKHCELGMWAHDAK